jgi:ATP-dependent Clp protease ATP-binding subunit ClpA
MFERFTTEAREVVMAAQAEARECHAGRIATEHLLLGLLRDPDSAGARLLGRLGLTAGDARADVARLAQGGAPGLDAGALATLGIDLEEVRSRVERTFGEGALARGTASVPGPTRVPFAPGSKKSLELALREAIALGDRHIGAEHVLLGLMREGDGAAARILRARGIDRAAVVEALGARRAG